MECGITYVLLSLLSFGVFSVNFWCVMIFTGAVAQSNPGHNNSRTSSEQVISGRVARTRSFVSHVVASADFSSALYQKRVLD
jgi:hypothetical protein